MLDEVNILAVDDDDDNLVALDVLLRRPGLRLVGVRSGTEALEALLAQDFALALLDVNMPGMDGFELAELMRGSERTRHVPIMFLTAAAPDRSRVFKGYEAGAVDFLFKPLDPHLLVSKVEVFAQLHRQKRQLAQQLEQIQQAQKMSDLFIGVLGHDLRNPLGGILSGAALLEKRPGEPEDTRRKARIIQRAAARMESLIQQVLDFALARVKGGIPVELVEADLAATARRVVSELDPAVAGRIQVEVLGDSAGSWDPDRMLQVVSNLVSNALEHGAPETPIQIRLDGRQRDSVSLEVKNGGAIPRATLDAIFSPFKPRERNTRGIGLGLYIVDQIVRAHAGEVTVRSSAEDGTTFVVRVPRGAEGDPRSPARILASQRP